MPVGSGAIGRQVKDLEFPQEAVCMAVLRGGKVLFPRADLTLQAEDRVIVLTTAQQELKVAQALG